MIAPRKANAPGEQGRGVTTTSKKASDDTRDHIALQAHSVSLSIIDLGKPSRTGRKMKRTWRRAGK